MDFTFWILGSDSYQFTSLELNRENIFWNKNKKRRSELLGSLYGFKQNKQNIEILYFTWNCDESEFAIADTLLNKPI